MNFMYKQIILTLGITAFIIGNARSQEYAWPDSAKLRMDLIQLSGDSIIYQNGNRSFVNRYADSLNIHTEGKPLPQFLKDANFDIAHFLYWEHSKQPNSLRYEIMSKVYNQLVLTMITESGDSSYQKLPEAQPEISIPFQNYSFSDLAKIRIEELKNRR